jgi:hypothetical protein
VTAGAMYAIAIFFGSLGIIGLALMWAFRNVEKMEVNHDE